MHIGPLSVSPVLDGVARFEPSRAYKDMPLEKWQGHEQFLDADGMVELAIGGFLVRGSGDHIVLVDNGIGEHGTGAFIGGELLTNLEALGVTADQVTDVVFTHLHFDHIGWTTNKAGEVVFKNATVRCDDADWTHFLKGAEPNARVQAVLAPIEDRLQTWQGSGPLLPGIDTMAAPGHTPGSAILVISSGTERGLLLGDVVHCPVELVDVEWDGMGDVDPELAKKTKAALAREIEGKDIPVAAAHFPGMVFGRLLKAEGKRYWQV